MKTPLFYKLSIITLFLFLVSCDNYKIVKLDKVKEFSYQITWDDLNISSKVKIKYMDERLHYIVELKDLDGLPIKETDYYESLWNGSILLRLLDEDSFLLLERDLPLKGFLYKHSNGTFLGEGSLQFEESEYLKIHDSQTGFKY